MCYRRAVWLLVLCGCAVAPGGVEGDMFGAESSSSGTGSSTDDTTGDMSSSSESTAPDSSTEVVESSGSSSSTGSEPACGDGNVDPGGICFGNKITFEMGAGARDVAIADFDGDGSLDIATLDRLAATVSVRFGDGTGGFGDVMSIAVTPDPFRMEAGDCDEDGDIDLVVAGDTLMTLMNDGGAFTAVESFKPGLFPDELSDIALVQADINPGLDIVHTTSLSAYFQGGIESAGEWVFGSEVTVNADADGATGIAMAPMSFSDDEIADLVFVNRNLDFVDVLRANGTGGFQHVSDVPACPANEGGYDAAIADLDGDGDDDLLVSCSSDQVAVILGEGDGTFGAPVYEYLKGAFRMVPVDIDHDGDIDVIATAVSLGRLTILANDGTGTFSQPVSLMVNQDVRSVAYADFDGDGAYDLLTAYGNDTSGFAVVYPGNP